MVYYLSESGEDIERYAEMDSGVMSVSPENYKRQMEYAQPENVHPSALEDNVLIWQQGYWLKPDTMPKQYLWANGDRSLPDVLPGFVVSSRFRELVEKFEAGVHQFIPVAIFKDRKGGPDGVPGRGVAGG